MDSYEQAIQVAISEWNSKEIIKPKIYGSVEKSENERRLKRFRQAFTWLHDLKLDGGRMLRMMRQLDTAAPAIVRQIERGCIKASLYQWNKIFHPDGKDSSSKECVGWLETMRFLVHQYEHWLVRKGIRPLPSWLEKGSRSVWLASLLAQEKPLNDKTYAYCLAYPLLDDYIDDPLVSEKAKSSLKNALLEGDPLPNSFPHKAVLQQCLETINISEIDNLGQALFSRMIYWESEVHGNTLATTANKAAYYVFALSYLIDSKLDQVEQQAKLALALQLVDDLQDWQEDVAAGRTSVFTEIKSAEVYEQTVERLLACIQSLDHRWLIVSDFLSATVIETVLMHSTLLSDKSKAYLLSYYPFDHAVGISEQSIQRLMNL